MTDFKTFNSSIPDCDYFFTSIYTQLLGTTKPELNQTACCNDRSIVCINNTISELSLNDAFNGIVPKELSNLTSLQSITITYSNIHGSIPKELALLPQLRRFQIGTSQLSGMLPTELLNHPTLESLDVRDNRIGGTLPSNINLPRLRDLSLANNLFEGPIPPNLILNSPNLWLLRIFNNQFNGTISPLFGNLKHLQYLEMARNKFSGTIPSELSNIPELYKLDLFRNNEITGPIPPQIIQMKYFKDFRFPLSISQSPANNSIDVTVFSTGFSTTTELFTSISPGSSTTTVSSLLTGSTITSFSLPTSTDSSSVSLTVTTSDLQVSTTTIPIQSATSHTPVGNDMSTSEYYTSTKFFDRSNSITRTVVTLDSTPTLNPATFVSTWNDRKESSLLLTITTHTVGLESAINFDFQVTNHPQAVLEVTTPHPLSFDSEDQKNNIPPLSSNSIVNLLTTRDVIPTETIIIASPLPTNITVSNQLGIYILGVSLAMIPILIFISVVLLCKKKKDVIIYDSNSSAISFSGDEDTPLLSTMTGLTIFTNNQYPIRLPLPANANESQSRTIEEANLNSITTNDNSNTIISVNDSIPLSFTRTPPSMNNLNTKWSIKRKIEGSGGSSQVYQALYAGQLAVAKVPMLDKHEQLVYREGQMLRKLKSPWTVKVLTFMSNGSIPAPDADYVSTALVLEFMNLGSLGSYLTPIADINQDVSLGNYQKVTSETLRIAIMVSNGLEFIHLSGYNHLDIKPDNILLHCSPDGELIAKLSDFGSARKEGSFDSVFQTTGYIPPEGFKIDNQQPQPVK
ncbi:hypothetical protein BC833DRAFT_607900 [Globomyces pollinis-pini]|nr:hypothetical protein BC833DRAFT_607900 [Globomyces pollinis-pini]